MGLENKKVLGAGCSPAEILKAVAVVLKSHMFLPITYHVSYDKGKKQGSIYEYMVQENNFKSYSNRGFCPRITRKVTSGTKIHYRRHKDNDGM